MINQLVVADASSGLISRKKDVQPQSDLPCPICGTTTARRSTGCADCGRSFGPLLVDDYIDQPQLYGTDVVSLPNANLSEMDLSRADMEGAELTGVDLRSSDLSGANLAQVTLTGADLSNADLSGASLKFTRLSE